MIGEPGGVGVMLFDPQIGFVIQQAVEHMGGIPHGGADELAVKGGVLVRDVRVECRARLVAVAGIDGPDSFAATSGFESLAIR